jgi:hypothetical protein
LNFMVHSFRELSAREPYAVQYSRDERTIPRAFASE